MAQEVSTKAVVFAIDDEKPNLELLERALSRICKVHTFQSGDKALAAAIESPPDLILLDYRMPGRNGVQVATELRASGIESPIMFITAYPQDPAVEGAVDLENVLWVTAKPYDPKALCEDVSKALTFTRFTERTKVRAKSE